MSAVKNLDEVIDREIPLCVDLDGTLVRSDLLIESALQLLKTKFYKALAMPVWLMAGKANLKRRLAEIVDLRYDLLPFNEEFVEYLRNQKSAGRKLILMTASDVKYAQKISDHLGLFDQVHASDGQTNMAGREKAAILNDTYGESNFDYAGNAKIDLTVWKSARNIVLVDPEPGVQSAAEKLGKRIRVFQGPGRGIKKYAKALRLHQWVKNLLIFVPLAAAHKMSDMFLLSQVVIAFFAFGLCASSVYVLNDLLDMEADRAHPSKKNRPFAAGTIPAKSGLLMFPALLALGIGTAALWLPIQFLAVLIFYYVLTLAYSLKLKAVVLGDVLVLAGLYTLRIISGAAVVSVPLSFWLLGFSMFLFLSLAMVKRYSELLSVAERGKQDFAAGRGYQVADLDTLISLGSASGYTSVLVLALYVNSEDVTALYTFPLAIWFICPAVLYWVSRVWLTARRGNMHDDPVVFAVKDPVSRFVAIICAAILFIAV